MTTATLPGLGDADLVRAIDGLLLRLLTTGTDERDERAADLPAGRDGNGLQAALDAARNGDSRHYHDIAALVTRALVSLRAGNLLDARRPLIQARHLACGPAPSHRQASRAA